MSELPDRVDPSEHIVRFLLHKSEFSIEKNRVKHSAFMPPQPPKIAEKSVYRIVNLSVGEMWDIGREYVSQPRKKTLRGGAELTVSVIINSSLQVVPNTDPHPRHANIRGWPEDKAMQLQKALDLAYNATLLVFVRPSTGC